MNAARAPVSNCSMRVAIALLMVSCAPSAHPRTEPEARDAMRSAIATSVASGPVGSGRVVITYHEDVGSALRRAEAQIFLDGDELYHRTFEASHPEAALDVFSGSTVVGKHELGVVVRFATRGYGIFSYVPLYDLKLTSRYAFTSAEGSSTNLDIVASVRGPIAMPIEKRLAIEVRRHP